MGKRGNNGKRNICHKRKLIYLHPTKCAGKSIEHALFDFPKMSRSDHTFANQYSKKQIEDYFVFSFVRNPYDRIISWFFDWAVRCEPNKYKNQNISYHIDASFGIQNNFKPFPEIWKQHTYKNQFFYEDKYVLDFCGRYENLEEDWKKLCKKINIDIKLPLINKNKLTRKHYSNYFNTQTKSYFENLFSFDIDYFDYEFKEEN